MRRYTVDSPLLMRHFSSEFRAHVRASVSRLERVSPEAGYAMYAEKYCLDYDYVCKLATIGAEIYSEILARMRLETREIPATCGTCGATKTTTVFISR